MINNDEESMYDDIRQQEIQTQDMIIELTFKILQPRLEFIKLEEEELKDDKMELEEQNKELKTKIKTNTDRFERKLKSL